jgi:hypothetical protein
MAMDQWLVRTAENVIAGPYTLEQVRGLIKDGQLSLQDEVCQANGYWIFLHETEEVAKQIGQDVIKYLGERGEDLTQTQTEPSIGSTPLVAVHGLDEKATDGVTTVVSEQAIRAELQLRRRPLTSTPGIDPSLVHVSPTGQKPFLKRVAWILITVIALAIFVFLNLSRD